MKSNKQRKTEIQTLRKKRAVRQDRLLKANQTRFVAYSIAPCNPELLAPYNSYGCPMFVERGYYVDLPFICRDCGKEEVWKATQQKWWYEIAKGNVESGPIRCRACRKIECARKAEARRVHFDGLERKRKPAG